MLGRVLSGPALFLMERGAEDGFSGSKEAGLIRGGFSPEKEKAPFQKRWKGAVTGSRGRSRISTRPSGNGGAVSCPPHMPRLPPEFYGPRSG